MRVIGPINELQDQYEVQVIAIPSDCRTKLVTMMAGRAAPDLFYLSQEHVQAFASQGALLDLTERIAGSDHPVIGLPWVAQPVIVYCNADLFRRAGVALPDGRWDWAQFVQTARRLTLDLDGDGRTDQWGFVINADG